MSLIVNLNLYNFCIRIVGSLLNILIGISVRRDIEIGSFRKDIFLEKMS